MAKPQITQRVDKGSPLTYAELDTNFTNLRDATITVAADGNNIVLDLNDTLTLTPGTNVTFGVAGNAVTVNASGGSTGLENIVEDTTPQLGGNLDVNGNQINNSDSDTITIAEDVILTNSSLVKISEIGSPGSVRIESIGNDPFVIGRVNTFGGSLDTSITLSSGAITIGRDADPDDKTFFTDVININSLTSTQQTGLSNPQNGDIMYNSTTNKFQGYANGSWVDFH